MMGMRTKNIENSKQTTARMQWVIRNSSSSSSISSKWSKVPEHIMHLVLPRLRISDYIRCGAVCRSWREAVDSAIAGKWCRPAPQPPLLLCRKPSFPNFFSPCERKVYKINLPSDGPYEKYVGSVEGWLIRADHTRRMLTLLNPVSGGRVMLPPLRNTPFFIRKAVASSVPTTSPHRACIVACLGYTGGETTMTLAVCRLTDKSWTRIDQCHSFHDMEFVDGKLYAATKKPSAFLMAFQFDIDDDDIQYRAERLVILDPGPDRERFEYILGTKMSDLFLAKDYSTSKQLFMITLAPCYSTKFIANSFQVFKLELNDNGGPRPQWVEVVKLRDRILFLRDKCIQFQHIRTALLDTHLRDCIGACLSLVTEGSVYLAPNPW